MSDQTVVLTFIQSPCLTTPIRRERLLRDDARYLGLLSGSEQPAAVINGMVLDEAHAFGSAQYSTQRATANNRARSLIGRLS